MTSLHTQEQEAREAARLFEQGMTYQQIGDAMGVTKQSAHRRVAMARRLGLDIDPAMRRAMDAVGATMEPSTAWIKTKAKKGEGGVEFSVMMRRKPDVPDPAEDVRERLDELFRTVPAVRFEYPEPGFWDGMATFALIPINDLHAGAYAWADETGGEDWDIDKATGRLTSWVTNLIARLPQVGEVILLFNGDTLHANDHKAMTPKSQNILDVDTRHFKVVDQTALAIITAVDLAAQAFPLVRVVIKPGNHDVTAYLSLLMAVKWRYHQQPNVLVDTTPGDFWAYRRAKTFLFSHHGDKAKPEQLVLAMASAHPDEWGASRYRYVWTGDKHHRAAKRIGGAMWEQASCMTEPDAYASSHGYTTAPELQAIVYHDDRGEIERHRVAAW
jgi:hypothetical protein